MVSRRPLATPGRELTHGQGGWFLHHSGQPELPGGLLHFCQVLAIPDTSLTQTAKAMRWHLAHDLLLRSTVATGPRHLPNCDTIHFLPITRACNSLAHRLVCGQNCVYTYLRCPPALAQVLLERQDFYLLHLYTFNSALYPLGAR